MRHIVLFVAAAATAYFLGPYAHTLTPNQRHIEIGVIVAVFFVIDFMIGQLRPRKPASRAGGSPYAAPAKRK
jgi:hypothetical protein